MAQRFEFELHPMESGRPQAGYEARRFVRILFRHKWKAISFFVIVMAGVTLFTMFSKRAYRAEGKLFVRLGRENVTVDPTATIGQPPAIVPSPTRENEINSLAELIRSQGLVERVVDAVGPEAILGTTDGASPGLLDQLRNVLAQVGVVPELTERERAIVKFEKNLNVEAVPKSNVIAITYNGSNRDTLRAAVNKLIDFYLKQHGELNRARGALDFLTEQTNRLRTSLVRSEEELRERKSELGMVSLEGRRDMLIKQSQLLQSQLGDAAAAAAASEADVQGLAAELAALPKDQVKSETSGMGDQGTDFMRSQFYALQIKEKELESRYTEAYPELRQIRAEAEAAKKVLEREGRTRTEVTTAPGRTYVETEIVLLRQKPILDSLKAKVDSYRKQLAEVKSEMLAFNADEPRLRGLQREIDIQDAKYRKYCDNLEQERIDQAMESQRISNISVAQPAVCEPKPIRPKPALYLLAGLGLALFGGIGIALTAEYLDRSMKTAEDLQAEVGLPNLASVPQFDKQQMTFTVRN